MTKIASLIIAGLLITTSTAGAQSWGYGYRNQFTPRPPSRIDSMENRWRTNQPATVRTIPNYGNPTAWGYDQRQAPYGRGFITNKPLPQPGGSLLR